MIRLRLLVVVIGFVTACSSGETEVERSHDSLVAAALPVEELVVDTGEVTLRVRVVGPTGADATVVTVHGGPGLSLEAMAVFESLAGSGRQVVGYDQRGAGRSTSPGDGDYGLDAQVADLESVRLALGADKVQLIGQSWGGAIAAAYAAAHPGHVSELVLIGAIPLDREEFRAGQRRFQKRVSDLQRTGEIPDPLPQNDGGSCVAAFEAFLPAYLADPKSHPETAVESCTAATSRATYEAFVADSSVEELAEKLGGFTGRALVLMGEHDAFGIGWLDRNVELLESATVEVSVVKGAGHLVMAERPDAVLATIATFLTG